MIKLFSWRIFYLCPRARGLGYAKLALPNKSQLRYNFEIKSSVMNCWSLVVSDSYLTTIPTSAHTSVFILFLRVKPPLGLAFCFGWSPKRGAHSTWQSESCKRFFHLFWKKCCVHFSGCFDNENGAPVPGGFAAGGVLSNSGMRSAMRNAGDSANNCQRLYLLCGHPADCIANTCPGCSRRLY